MSLTRTLRDSRMGGSETRAFMRSPVQPEAPGPEPLAHLETASLSLSSSMRMRARNIGGAGWKVGRARRMEILKSLCSREGPGMSAQAEELLGRLGRVPRHNRLKSSE